MISNTSTPIPDDSLLFPQLDNSEIRNIFDQSQFDLNDSAVAKLKNLTFNPFSLNNNGKPYLTLNSDLDPDQNYYNQIITHVETCDYHDEDTVPLNA